jgi:hypothetical protein
LSAFAADGSTKNRRFNMDFVIGDEQSQPGMMERDIVPAGVHQMVIKHVEEGPNQYKACDENPDGQCLKLRLATCGGNHKFVFDDIPKHLGWRAKQLAEAIGVMAGGTKLSLATSDLDGLEVTVEVSHYTSKTGKVSAVVKRYVPRAAAPSPAVAKPRSQAAKALAASGSEDIPF